MPERDFTHASFQEYLAEGRLMGVRCRGCGDQHAVPRPLCPSCFGTDMEWVQFSGRGQLEAFTVVHVAPTHMVAAGHGRENPYCAGVVRLREGPAIAAQILDVETARPETISVGIPVRVAFLRRGSGDEERTFLAFRPEI